MLAWSGLNSSMCVLIHRYEAITCINTPPKSAMGWPYSWAVWKSGNNRTENVIKHMGAVSRESVFVLAGDFTKT